ncbi:hypothetical protein M0R45_036151 [Rubus argutus]|uniref:Uncharacterized protein n=1 Tax=Rubus argutus TaxID=59490 RepID=A0AAW1VYW6_RUBAR
MGRDGRRTKKASAISFSHNNMRNTPSSIAGSSSPSSITTRVHNLTQLLAVINDNRGTAYPAIPYWFPMHEQFGRRCIAWSYLVNEDTNEGVWRIDVSCTTNSSFTTDSPGHQSSSGFSGR